MSFTKKLDQACKGSEYTWRYFPPIMVHDFVMPHAGNDIVKQFEEYFFFYTETPPLGANCEHWYKNNADFYICISKQSSTSLIKNGNGELESHTMPGPDSFGVFLKEKGSDSWSKFMVRDFEEASDTIRKLILSKIVKKVSLGA